MIGRGLLVLAAMLLVFDSAAAHEVLDTAAMEDYLGRLDRAALAGEDRARTAEALFERGEVLSESVGLLNQDYMVHAGSHGTVAEIYLRELAARGLAPVLSPDLGRYPIPTRAYERYLAETDGQGEHAAEALHEIIAARFHDSFSIDPFAPLSDDWDSIRLSIADAEAFVSRFPDHPDLPEVRFILAVTYGRAASMAPDAADRRRYRAAAADGLSDFAAAYPQSMRAAAAEALLARLDAD